MVWQKIGNSVLERLFRNSVIVENQWFYILDTFIVFFKCLQCTNET